MGLRRAYLEFIERNADVALGGLRGRRMLELGNQRIGRREGIRAKTGKAYFTARGAEHLSIDLNGKDGAVVLDLSLAIHRPDWEGRFDVITNAGTTEHVEPFERQYECFDNLHRWLKPGGIAVHIVPAIEELESTGRWRQHCNNYYSAKFFESLAAHNDYALLASTVINDLRAACLQKRGERPFMADRAAFLAHLTRREGGKDYSHLLDRGTGAGWRRVLRRLRLR